MSTERNWAGNLEYHAQSVEHPDSIGVLHDLIRQGQPMRVLGSRHCFNDIADTHGTLISMDRMPSVLEVSADRHAVRVSGGSRYGDIAPELHRHGLALANLASLPHISVAGAIATGTHGSGDRIGALATAVRALTVVDAHGQPRVLRRGDAEFAGAVVSLGALGVVTELELDVEPAYDMVQTVHESPSWDALLADFDGVTSLGTSVSIFSRWNRTDVADQLWIKNRTDASSPDADLLHRLGSTPAVVARHPILGVPAEATTVQLGEVGAWYERLPHFRLEFTPSAGEELQSEYLVPRADAIAAIEAVRSLAYRIAPLLLVNEIRTVASDELWLSSSYGADVVGLHFTWKRDQPAIEAVLPALEAALPESARPHWGKIFTLDAAEVRRRYPQWGGFAALRARFDPEGLFLNDYLRRLGL